MKKTGYIYDAAFLAHETPPGHPERSDRLEAVNHRLRENGLWEQIRHIAPHKADRATLVAVHAPGYVDSICGLDAPAYLDGGDTYFSAGTLEAALRAAGSGPAALDALQDGSVERCFLAVRPPGHHAEADRAMGFCVFNNIAVTAREARHRGYERVFIVDFDVHHGNGTEHIFAGDPSVFYFSTHQSPHFPGTGAETDRGHGPGEGFTRNVPMAAGSGDDEYMRVYTELVPTLIEGFRPDLLLVSAGYDIHVRDPLSFINVSTATIGRMTRAILDAAPDRPAVFFLEGGYDLDGLADSVSRTIEVLLEE